MSFSWPSYKRHQQLITAHNFTHLQLGNDVTRYIITGLWRHKGWTDNQPLISKHSFQWPPWLNKYSWYNSSLPLQYVFYVIYVYYLSYFVQLVHWIWLLKTWCFCLFTINVVSMFFDVFSAFFFQLWKFNSILPSTARLVKIFQLQINKWINMVNFTSFFSKLAIILCVTPHESAERAAPRRGRWHLWITRLSQQRLEF